MTASAPAAPGSISSRAGPGITWNSNSTIAKSGRRGIDPAMDLPKIRGIAETNPLQPIRTFRRRAVSAPRPVSDPALRRNPEGNAERPDS
jgi:hypothetical protein